MPGLGLAESDVRQPPKMQTEEAQVDALLHQQHGFLDEVPLVAYKGEDHAYRQHVIEREPRCQVDGQDVLDAEDQVVQSLEGDLRATQPDIRIDHLGIAVEPEPFPLAFTIEQLQALHRANGLDESRVLLRLALDGGLAALPEHTEQAESQDSVER